MSLHTDLDEPSWVDILRACQDQVQARIHTALPGIVTAYDSPTQTCTVQLAVQLKGDAVPPLADVPVAWPGGAAGVLHVPLEVGDSVLVVFSEEDYSNWWISGSVSAPAVLARHGLHGIAIPGLRRATAPASVTGGHVTLAARDELRLGSDAATIFVALASLVDARLAALQNAFDTHVHATAAVGPPVPPTAVPGVIPVGPLASVAAMKVKAI